MKESLNPEQTDDLRKMNRAFKSMEESIGSWFYPVLFSIEHFEDAVIESFVAQHEKDGFEFSITSSSSLDYPKRPLLLPGKDYYLHRNDEDKYLRIEKKEERGVFGDRKA